MSLLFCKGHFHSRRTNLLFYFQKAVFFLKSLSFRAFRRFFSASIPAINEESF